MAVKLKLGPAHHHVISICLPSALQHHMALASICVLLPKSNSTQKSKDTMYVTGSCGHNTAVHQLMRRQLTDWEFMQMRFTSCCMLPMLRYPCVLI